jgi:4-aminobutyrate aminotransferase / (S)-3-amino-2-methylpropionate transaminase / 5-aminovalerate transaminase
MINAATNQSLHDMRTRVVPAGHSSGNTCYIASAKGALLYDVEGREYIDFAGGIAVMNVGHSHPRVVAAIKEQADKLTHSCFMVLPYAPAVLLADKLCAAVPGPFDKMALLVNSGVEAVENAVKIARYATRRQAVIAFENAFHGRTYLGMSLTSKVKPYKLGFGPFVPEIYRIPFAYCYRCPFNLKYPECDTACADYLKDFFTTYVAAEATAAVIAEPIQGEGGFITPPPGYFAKIKQLCQDNGILFIADEIQTGMGRTGTMFAMTHWGVAADITTVAKSLAAGMPLSAVVGRKEIMDTVHPGGIGGTYGGNPVACAAALAVFEIFESEHLLATSRELGAKLRSRLDRFHEQFELVGDVRGIGPMLAMELVENRHTKAPAADQAKALAKYCFDQGLIILTCGTLGNVIRLLMPLNIADEELQRGLAIIENGLNRLSH